MSWRITPHPQMYNCIRGLSSKEYSLEAAVGVGVWGWRRKTVVEKPDRLYLSQVMTVKINRISYIDSTAI